MNRFGSVWIASAPLVWAAVVFGGESEPAAQLAGWVEQLGAAQFAQREAAAKSLVDAGQAAIAPLERAIRGGELEVAARGIEILRDMLAADDPATAAAAERLLDSLAEQGEPPLAHLAASVLDFHLVGAAEQARRAVEEAGAVVRERSLVAGQRGLEVELGPAWRGGVAGLRQLARLRGLTSVSVHGLPIDATAAAVLGRLRGVRRIDLYGTGIPEAAVAKLTAALPHAVIDVRKGGRLGVSSLAFGGPCEITHVQPGSAAAKAGVKVGDVVIALDGEPIASFEALTQRVSRRAAGDVLTLSIARQAAGGAAEQFDCSVTLDAW
jgi:hypothetical protein